MKRVLFFICLYAITGCNQDNKKKELEKETPVNSFVANVEVAHNKSIWERKRAVAFDIDLQFGDRQGFQGKVTSLTNSSAIRIDKKDGTKIIYNGQDVFVCPEDALTENDRSDIFTWQYFFALPFKLDDPGTELEILDRTEINEEVFHTALLSFSENTGDSPDDWYLLYQESDTGLLHAAAYIVTINSEKEEAEKNPHAIVYRLYEVKEGIPVSTRWTFHNWSKENGLGEQIGEATISNVIFFNAEDDLFERPENSLIVER